MKWLKKEHRVIVVPGKFYQNGSNTDVFGVFLVDGKESGSKCHLKLAIIGPPAKRSMAFRWRTDNGPTLNVGLVAL